MRGWGMGDILHDFFTRAPGKDSMRFLLAAVQCGDRTFKTEKKTRVRAKPFCASPLVMYIENPN
jgi:hypothetical protein